ELVDAGAERLQHLLICLQPSSAVHGHARVYADYFVDERVRRRLLAAKAIGAGRPLEQYRDAVSAADSAIDLEQSGRARERRHVRIEVRDLNARGASFFYLRADLDFHLRQVGLRWDVGLEHGEVTVSIEQC